LSGRKCMVKFSPMDLVNTLEKMTSFAFLLFLTSLVLFINLYLLYNHDISIHSLTLEWIKAHATVSEAVTFGMWFMLLYLFAFPALHWFTTEIVAMIYFKLPIPMSSRPFRSSLVRLATLRDFAVQNNNSVAYKVYEDRTAALNRHESDMAYMRSSCFAILVLAIAHVVNFYPFIATELARLPRLFHLPLLGFLCWVVYYAFHDATGASRDDACVYLPSFDSSDKKRVRPL